MKKIIFTALLYLAFHISFAQTNEVPKTGPQIAFKDLSHDFGDMIQGDKVTYTFKFTNSGTEPLLVSEVVTTCGCTATKWTKEPVLPGKEGEIVATFNSENKMGRQNKTITILSNAVNNPSRVSIVCNVLPKGTVTEKK